MSTRIPSSRRRLVVAAVSLVAAATALLNSPAGAGATSKPLNGRVFAELSSGPSCASPVGLCAVGEMIGGIQGSIVLTVQSIMPSGTPGLTYVESTSVIHTKSGDLFLASSAVGNMTGTGDGEFVSLDRITGGTGKYAGASGYLQSREFVVGTSDTGEYEGKLVLP
ncbi:MAG: hypothetical protein ACR2KK_09375 [Acidimicrobiales bacterium]